MNCVVISQPKTLMKSRTYRKKSRSTKRVNRRRATKIRIKKVYIRSDYKLNRLKRKLSYYKYKLRSIQYGTSPAQEEFRRKVLEKYYGLDRLQGKKTDAQIAAEMAAGLHAQIDSAGKTNMRMDTGGFDLALPLGPTMRFRTVLTISCFCFCRFARRKSLASYEDIDPLLFL